MSKLSFEGIGAVVATFSAGEGVKGGQPVKLTGNGAVGPCSAGEAFCGVAMEPRAGLAAVQVGGFVTVPSSGDVAVGRATLVADGNGGVKPAPAATVEPGDDGAVTIPVAAGVPALVVSVESDGTAVLLL